MENNPRDPLLEASVLEALPTIQRYMIPRRDVFEEYCRFPFDAVDWRNDQEDANSS